MDIPKNAVDKEFAELEIDSNKGFEKIKEAMESVYSLKKRISKECGRQMTRTEKILISLTRGTIREEIAALEAASSKGYKKIKEAVESIYSLEEVISKECKKCEVRTEKMSALRIKQERLA